MLNQGKDQSVESLRGFAILLVLGLHLTNDGAIVPAQAFYDYLAYSFQNIRIPLFTILSGYLFGLRPVGRGCFGQFLGGKVRRILIPLIVVASLEFIAKSTLPGVNNPESLGDIWKAFLFPYEHYWFLQVIFLLFLLFGFLHSVDLLPSWRNWLVIAALSLLLYLGFGYTGLSLSVFSLGATTYLVPFFVLGFGIAQHGERLMHNRMILIWLVVFTVTFSYQQYLWFAGAPGEASKRSLTGLVVALSSGCLLLRFRVPVWGLATVGSYAYVIYLYQGFGLSLGRRIMSVLPEINPHIYFIGLIATAVIFGILVEKIGKRIPYLRMALLGIKK